MTDKNLVSVETQTEFSATSDQRETRIFLKMYVDAVHSGLLANLGDKNWRTLCVIAAFMDEKGECYPTQAQIAKGLGVSRQAASTRVNTLLKYRWNDRALVTAVKGRSPKGKWENTRYTVLPISQLRIFEAEPEEIPKPMSGIADTADDCTNKN
jgi:hypothetical protein